MQLAHAFRRSGNPIHEDRDRALAVYRRHAMRAMREERWIAAAVFFDRMIEVDPRNTEALLMKGYLAEHCSGDPGRALECYRKVVHLCGPGSDDPNAHRARCAITRIVRRWS